MRRLLVLLALPAALSAAASFGQQAGSPDPEEVARLVVGLTNEFRGQEGRQSIGTNANLTAAARYFADYMARTDRFSHDADGSVAAARATQHGYDYCMIAENIAQRYSPTGFAAGELARRIVDQWKRSPGHRGNMLEPDVTETGVGVAPGIKRGHYYAVQIFGRPASQAIVFRITNRTDSAMSYRMGGKTFLLEPRQTWTHKQCGSVELTFEWPGQHQGTALRPRQGDRYAVVRSESGGFNVTSE